MRVRGFVRAQRVAEALSEKAVRIRALVRDLDFLGRWSVLRLRLKLQLLEEACQVDDFLVLLFKLAFQFVDDHLVFGLLQLDHLLMLPLRVQQLLLKFQLFGIKLLLLLNKLLLELLGEFEQVDIVRV